MAGKGGRGRKDKRSKGKMEEGRKKKNEEREMEHIEERMGEERNSGGRREANGVKSIRNQGKTT